MCECVLDACRWSCVGVELCVGGCELCGWSSVGGVVWVELCGWSCVGGVVCGCVSCVGVYVCVLIRVGCLCV